MGSEARAAELCIEVPSTSGLSPEFLDATGRRGQRRGHRRSASLPAEALAMEYLSEAAECSSGQATPRSSAGFSDAADISPAEIARLLAHSTAEGLPLDPKRAKRILANRLSAARSKERKLKYISDLEHRVSILQRNAAGAKTEISQWEAHLELLSKERQELEAYISVVNQQQGTATSDV